MGYPKYSTPFLNILKYVCTRRSMCKRRTHRYFVYFNVVFFKSKLTPSKSTPFYYHPRMQQKTLMIVIPIYTNFFRDSENFIPVMPGLF